MGIFDGIVGAGLNFIGGQISNAQNQSNFESAQNFSAGQAADQRNWEENMRATQYQTAVKDMSAAGLNPMLAYSHGGAGTPTGASASSPAPPKIENTLGPAVSSAFEAMRTMAEADLKRAETDEARQRINIKSPVEAGAGYVKKGIDTVGDGVANLSNSLSEFVQAVEDKAPAAAASVKGALEQARIAVGDVIDKGVDIVKNPKKAIESVTSSAGEVVKRAADAYGAAGRAINGPPGVKPNASRGKLRMVPEVDTSRVPKSGIFSNKFYNQ